MQNQPRLKWEDATRIFLDHMEEFQSGVLLSELLTKGKKERAAAANDGLLLMRLPDKEGRPQLRAQLFATVNSAEGSYWNLNVRVSLPKDQINLLETGIAKYTQMTGFKDVALTHVKVKLKHSGNYRFLELEPSCVVVDELPRPWMIIPAYSIGVDEEFILKTNNSVFQSSVFYGDQAMVPTMSVSPALKTYFTGAERYDQVIPIPKSGPITWGGTNFDTLLDLYAQMINIKRPQGKRLLCWQDFLTSERYAERCKTLIGKKENDQLFGLRYFADLRDEEFDQDDYEVLILEALDRYFEKTPKSTPASASPKRPNMLGSITK